MKIETKFDIGDTVWAERFNWDFESYIPEKITIERMLMVVRKNKSFEISYFGNGTFGFFEDEVHPTKKECKLACDVKNKINRKDKNEN